VTGPQGAYPPETFTNLDSNWVAQASPSFAAM